jgi:hypothetical protein
MALFIACLKVASKGRDVGLGRNASFELDCFIRALSGGAFEFGP